MTVDVIIDLRGEPVAAVRASIMESDGHDYTDPAIRAKVDKPVRRRGFVLQGTIRFASVEDDMALTLRGNLDDPEELRIRMPKAASVEHPITVEGKFDKEFVNSDTYTTATLRAVGVVTIRPTEG